MTLREYIHKLTNKYTEETLDLPLYDFVHDGSGDHAPVKSFRLDAVKDGLAIRTFLEGGESDPLPD